MMHVIYAVIGIALTVLVTFGGVSYFAADAPVRVVAARSLDAQYEVLKAAVVSYRNTNNGLNPKEMRHIAGILPGGQVPIAGAASQGYGWDLRMVDAYPNPVICLAVDTEKTGSTSATATFVKELVANGEADAVVGNACGEGEAVTSTTQLPTGAFTITLSGY